MYRELLADATFHNLLLACDRDLADTARAGRCSLCGGVLHSATYPRKPRGRPMKLGPEHDRRFSFCCAVGGCRSRATPPWLRFLGPKVYLATIVVLVSIMRHGTSASRVQRMAELLVHALQKAGAVKLMTPELIATLADHAQGNPRALMTIAGELLAVAAQREARHIDEKLFLETTAPPVTETRTTSGRRR